MERIFALDPSLPKKGSRALLRSLHSQLRAAIIEGRLQAGVRLPASRALAQSLNVSRNTVVLAYEMLVSEGYLVTNASAGTSVANVRPKQAKQRAVLDEGKPDHRLTRFWQNSGRLEIKDDNRPARYDFRHGNTDMSQFPFDVWRRLTRRAVCFKIQAALPQR